MQSMYDLVGDRIQEIFDAQVVDIGVLDRDDRARSHSRTRSSAASDYPDEPLRRPGGFQQARPRDARTAPDQRALSRSESHELGGAAAHRYGRAAEVRGVRAARRRRRGDRRGSRSRTSTASTRSARPTCACSRPSPGSLSVALENARLFEETRQRNAELALINDVQRGLAENLEMQAMYDLVGDRLREIFDAQVVDIGVLDARPGLLRFPYVDRARRAFSDEPQPAAERVPHARARDARAALRSTSTSTSASPSWGRPPRWARARRPRSAAVRPAGRRRRGDRRDLAPEPRPRARVQRGGRPAARRRSRAASASRSRTRACSTRPGSGTPSSR